MGKKHSFLILKFSIGVLFFVFLSQVPGSGQSLEGRVLSNETRLGLGFVDIGIIGKNIGTVSNDSGYYSIEIDKSYENDSLRFSLVGYQPRSFIMSQFIKDSIKKVYLIPKIYNLEEVKVIGHRTKEITLGNPVISNELRTGFPYNDLGSELGVLVDARKPVLLTDLNLNVAVCTFDSVKYRLNIYQKVNKSEFVNILSEPVYLSFSKDEIENVIKFNLRKYAIVVFGQVLIALELYDDLGEGRLLFHTEFYTGTTYHRKTSEGTWVEQPGVIGMYLHGHLLK